jgi:hypothetical protein
MREKKEQTEETQAVANKAALALFDGSQIADHSKIFVASYRQEWRLEKTSSAVLQADMVIAAVGGGRWFREIAADPVWTGQLTWECDSVAGSDEGTGMPGFPLKTLAELSRRLQNVQGGATYVVNILGAATSATDLPLFRPRIIPGVAGSVMAIRFVGLRTVMALGSGALTAATATAGNVQGSIAGPAVWANFIGRHIRMTSGAANGAVAVILEDLGAGSAEVSEWINESTLALTAIPAAADTYEIVSETSWLTPLQVFSTAVQNMDVEMVNLSIDTASFVGLDTLRMTGCRTTVPIAVPGSLGDLAKVFARNHAWSFGALSTGFSLFTSAFLEIVGGGAVNARLQVSLSSSCRIRNFVMNRSQFTTQGGAVIIVPGGVVNLQAGTKWGIHRSPAATPGLNIIKGTTCVIAGTLYGQLNSVGCKVASGATCMVTAAVTPTLTGTVELNFDDQVTALPDLLPSAGLLLPAAAPLVTWAQWAGAPFNRNVVSFKSAAKIINLI